MNTAIKVSHLTKIYKLYDKPSDRLKESLHPLKKKYHKEFYALNDVSFEIKKGETVGIIGKNGAGKSTLLKIITGVLTPSSGSVHVNGRIASLLELGAGFNPEYTGIENIYLQGTLMGYSHEEMEAKVDDILAFADIGDFIHQSVKMYSSGMFARLAFAVAINVDPDILIVDEALSVGDAAFQRKCFARMETFRDQGKTVLFVSHSEQQIVQLCSRAILVHAGTVLLDGIPKPVVTLYTKMMLSDDIDSELIQKEYNSYSSIVNESATEKLSQQKVLQHCIEEDFFDENMLSVPVFYPTQGAEILSVVVKNTADKIVNVLQNGQNYFIETEGVFDEDAYKVHFAFHIRTTSGLLLTGQRYPALGEHIDHIKAGTTYKVVFEVDMLLMPDTYFIGTGVWSNGEANECLHRIIDVAMFRVQPLTFHHLAGFVNIMPKKPILFLLSNAGEEK